MGYGLDSVVSINFQNSFGTQITTSNYFIPVLENTLSLGKEPLADESFNGIYDTNNVYEGMNMNEGNIQFQADMLSLGVALRALCGAPTTTTSDSLATHVFQPRQQGEDFDQFIANDPLTIITDLDVGSAHVHYDMCATGLEFQMSNGEFTKVSQNYIGGKWTRINPPTASYQTENLWPWDVSSISLADTAIDEFNELTVTIEEPIENKYTLTNAKTPTFTKRSDRRTITVAGTIIFNDQVEYDEFVNQTERRMVITLDTGTEVQSGYTEACEIDLPAFRYNTYEPSVSAAGLIEAPFEGQAVYHAGSGTAATFTLTNTQATY